jgi:hypothetical protein
MFLYAGPLSSLVKCSYTDFTEIALYIITLVESYGI